MAWERSIPRSGTRLRPVYSDWLSYNTSEANSSMAETGKSCSVQETLYHFFGLPIHVIAQQLSPQHPRLSSWRIPRFEVLVASVLRDNVEHRPKNDKGFL